MQVSTMGVDLAKSVFQVHGVDAAGEVVVVKKLRRSQVLGFFAGQRRAGWGWRPAARRTTGRGRSRGYGDRVLIPA